MENYDGIIENNASKEQQEDRPTTAEWSAAKQEERKNLYALATEMTDKVLSDPEALKTYLDMQARLGKASVNNVMLAIVQKPEASYLLSFEAWLEKGRFVQRGEKGIAQFVANGEYERPDGTTGVSIDVKRVFDVSQTYGKPVNQRATQSMPLKAKIKALTKDAPVSIALADGVMHGARYDAAENAVKVERGLDADNMFYCIARELAQADMARNNPGDYEHASYVFDADCAAQIVCARYGVKAPLPQEIPYDVKDRDPVYKKAVLNCIRGSACEINERVNRNLYLALQQAKNEPER